MRSLRVALAAVGLMVALVVPGVASAQINEFQIGPTGELGPEGASVNVPVTVNCEEGWAGNIQLRIRQAQGKRRERRLVDGTGYEPVTCTGTDQTVIVVVDSVSGVFPAVPFRRGSAAADGNLFIFNPITSQPDDARVRPQTIQIVRR